ncbi:hypothetical protein IMG5_114750 [Ichthyophthirius multifiliis]|uniref:Uncharacterized protein n=1 Tax=Ichthyophthirius multifiliis TaxID=5932 RepID=G0QU42_ICHMU|nr:hypothetical protein IMG5_114750 [Ichthyophthirius multifiliis]EGR31266.1 hypothetical protein IMG5_114750 [Ichthyophthirius multifiliis]|eukprot:XP_004034752.1 hypothetical protein IMG5_114750 [Ichthyophthirius multifiliis]
MTLKINLVKFISQKIILRILKINIIKFLKVSKKIRQNQKKRIQPHLIKIIHKYKIIQNQFKINLFKSKKKSTNQKTNYKKSLVLKNNLKRYRLLRNIIQIQIKNQKNAYQINQKYKKQNLRQIK